MREKKISRRSVPIALGIICARSVHTHSNITPDVYAKRRGANVAASLQITITDYI
jgi:hypothetical protein